MPGLVGKSWRCTAGSIAWATVASAISTCPCTTSRSFRVCASVLPPASSPHASSTTRVADPRMSEDTVRLLDVARGVIRRIPDAFDIQKAALNLLLLRREWRGSIGALLEKQAKKHPDRHALVFEGRTWTYAEFNAWANRCAAVFRKQGIGPGDAVGLL